MKICDVLQTAKHKYSFKFYILTKNGVHIFIVKLIFIEINRIYCI